MKLVRDRTSLTLAKAKPAVQRVVDGEYVALTFATVDEAKQFIIDAAEIGAIVHGRVP